MIEAMNSTHNEQKDIIEAPIASLESPNKADRLYKRLEEAQSRLTSLTEKLQEAELQIKVSEADSSRKEKEAAVKIEELEAEKV